MQCYGGTVVSWEDVPLADLTFLSDEMAKVYAEDNMRKSEIALVGSGAMSPEDVRATWDRWIDEAGLIRTKRKASKADMAGMGIKTNG
jgi:hypothetical protein